MTSYLTYSPISPMMTNFIWKVSKFPSSFCIIKQNTSPLVTFDTFIWAAIAQQSTHEYGRINHVNLKRNDTITTKKTSTRKPVYIWCDIWYMPWYSSLCKRGALPSMSQLWIFMICIIYSHSYSLPHYDSYVRKGLIAVTIKSSCY